MTHLASTIGQRTPYGEFLRRQVGRILSRGGSDLDVANYLKHLEGVPLQDVIEAPPDPDAQVPTPSLPLGLSMSALQGLTFGLGDEALGGLAGLATIVTAGGLEQATQVQRATTEGFREQRAAFRETRPLAALAGEVAGGAILPAVGGAAVAGRVAPSLAGRLGLASAAGAAGGAAVGFGETQGPISERAKNALWGGGLGALLGPVAQLGLTIGGKVGERLVRSAPVRALVDRVRSWGTALQTRTATVPQARARELVATAVAQDGIDFATLVTRAQQAAARGQPATLADLGGEETFRLALAAQGLRGQAKQQLADELMTRAGEEGPRLMDALLRSTRLGLKNAYEAAEQLQADATRRAAPLYERAHKIHVGVTESTRKLFREPAMQDAYLLAKSAADLEDRLLGAGAKGLPIPPLPEKLDDLSILPIRAFDYTKQKLDELIERGVEGKPILGRREAHALREALNEALEEVDFQSQDYKAARAIWRGSQEARDALALGKGGKRLFAGQEETTPRFSQKQPEQVAGELSRLDPTLHQFYRLGAMQDLADAIYAQTGETPEVARRFFGARAFGVTERSAERRIRHLFDDPDVANDFMDRAHAEAMLRRRGDVLATKAGVTPAIGTLGEELVGAGTTVTRAPIRRGPGIELLSFTQRQLERLRAGWTEEVSDEVSLLFTKGLNSPHDLTTLLDGLRPWLAQARRRTAAAVVTGAVAGEQAGQAVAPR